MVLHQTQLKLTQTLTASQLKIMTAGRSIKMYGEYSIKTLKSRKSAIEVFRTVITSQPEMSGVVEMVRSRPTYLTQWSALPDPPLHWRRTV